MSEVVLIVWPTAREERLMQAIMTNSKPLDFYSAAFACSGSGPLAARAVEVNRKRPKRSPFVVKLTAEAANALLDAMPALVVDEGDAAPPPHNPWPEMRSAILARARRPT